MVGRTLVRPASDLFAIVLLTIPFGARADGLANAPPGPAANPASASQPAPAGYPPPTGNSAPGSPPPAGSPPTGYYYYPPPAAPYGYPRAPPNAVPASPPHVHDGFFMRLHLGGGYVRVKVEDMSGRNLVFKGGGSSIGMALGGAITENLILFGEFFRGLTSQADVSGTATIDVTGFTAAELSGLGGGVLYYFPSLNVYIAGALSGIRLQIAAASLTTYNLSTAFESNAGVGFHGILGKEWWVSPNWGLGIAADAAGAWSAKDRTNSTTKWTGQSVSLLFSATYN